MPLQTVPTPGTIHTTPKRLSNQEPSSSSLEFSGQLQPNAPDALPSGLSFSILDLLRLLTPDTFELPSSTMSYFSRGHLLTIIRNRIPAACVCRTIHLTVEKV